MAHVHTEAIEMAPVRKGLWALARKTAARLARHHDRHPSPDTLSAQHHKDLGLNHSEIRAASPIPLSVDAFTILAIRDCGGRTANRQSRY
jgi:hypothetical protein